MSMKDFICTLLRGLSLVGGFFGAILVMTGAIEKVYAFTIMFGFMFLWFFVDWIEEHTETNEPASDSDEKKEKQEWNRKD